jgi:hypothetical protein
LTLNFAHKEDFLKKLNISVFSKVPKGLFFYNFEKMIGAINQDDMLRRLLFLARSLNSERNIEAILPLCPPLFYHCRALSF